jgi:hypothetical protein
MLSHVTCGFRSDGPSALTSRSRPQRIWAASAVLLCAVVGLQRAGCGVAAAAPGGGGGSYTAGLPPILPVRGELDDTSCNVEEVERANSQQVRTILTMLECLDLMCTGCVCVCACLFGGGARECDQSRATLAYSGWGLAGSSSLAPLSDTSSHLSLAASGTVSLFIRDCACSKLRLCRPALDEIEGHSKEECVFV